MNAKKCDRCGKYYDEYGTANDKKNTNSVIFANTDAKKEYWKQDIVDLCPECMKEVKDFIYKGVKK